MKVGICGNYGVSNLGDEAILKALVDAVQHVYPRAEITVFGVGMLFPLGVRSFLKSIVRWNLWKKPLKGMRECDMVIVGGGGLFADDEGAFVSVFWALHGVIAHLMGKPVLALGISVGMVHLWNRGVVRYFFKKCRAVGVRDLPTQQLLDRWKIQNVLLSDITLLLQVPHVQFVEKNKEKYVAISLRSFKNQSDILYTNIAQVCDFLIKEYGFLIRLIPFQGMVQNDAYILNKIIEQSHFPGRIKYEPFQVDFSKALEIIRGAKVVIAMRLHAGIFSLLEGTPFIPITYMRKVGDFWSEFPEITSLNIEQISAEKVLAVIDTILKDSEREKNRLATIKYKLRDRASKIYDLLSVKV